MTTIRALLPYGLRNNVNPNLIVVHCMAENVIMDDGEVLRAVDLLAKLKRSAHRLVAPNGDEYICRKDNQGAFHAKGFNESSLGVEFLVSGEMNYAQFLARIKTPYVTDAQLETGTRIVREWIEAYDVLTVARHSDLSPGVKFDPGDGFPWDSFLTDLGV